MSAIRRFADLNRTSAQVRKVPKAEVVPITNRPSNAKAVGRVTLRRSLAAVLPEFPRRHVSDAAERTREACLRREARTKRDFAQRELAGAYHFHSRVETSTADIALRRHPHLHRKHPSEVEFAEVRHLREVI